MENAPESRKCTHCNVERELDSFADDGVVGPSSGRVYNTCLVCRLTQRKSDKRFERKSKKQQLRGIPNALPKDIYEALLLSPCFYCGHDSGDTTQQSIDRLDSVNGSYTSGNVVTACFACQYDKRSMDPLSFYERARTVSYIHDGPGEIHEEFRECATTKAAGESDAAFVDRCKRIAVHMDIGAVPSTTPRSTMGARRASTHVEDPQDHGTLIQDISIGTRRYRAIMEEKIRKRQKKEDDLREGAVNHTIVDNRMYERKSQYNDDMPVNIAWNETKNCYSIEWKADGHHQKQYTIGRHGIPRDVKKDVAIATLEKIVKNAGTGDDKNRWLALDQDEKAKIETEVLARHGLASDSGYGDRGGLSTHISWNAGTLCFELNWKDDHSNSQRMSSVCSQGVSKDVKQEIAEALLEKIVENAGGTRDTTKWVKLDFDEKRRIEDEILARHGLARGDRSGNAETKMRQSQAKLGSKNFNFGKEKSEEWKAKYRVSAAKTQNEKHPGRDANILRVREMLEKRVPNVRIQTDLGLSRDFVTRVKNGELKTVEELEAELDAIRET